MELNLTDEQRHAIELALDGESLKIEAFAGAGKTSTLCAIGEVLDTKKGLYLAFNKLIADEANRKFSANVDCRTAHSAAFRAVGRDYAHRLGRIKGSDLTRQYLKMKDGLFSLSLSATGYLLLDTVTNFCRSADEELGEMHVPYQTVVQVEEVLKIDRQTFYAKIVPMAKKIWSLMADINGTFPITHDTYLKIWALQKPDLEVDFILFDEAQDANAVLLDLVKRQPCQQIYVGDKYQSIYGWRGAVNAMDKIKTPHACQITQSFRFGQAIANVANRILRKHGVFIRGYNNIQSSVRALKSPSAIISRTNATLIENLLRRSVANEKVFIAGGVTELLSFLKGAENLQEGQPSYHKDLAIFKSWDEVVEYSKTEAGSDIAGLVKIIEENNIEKLIAALNDAKNIKESDATLVLSTAHKAKGRQWQSVKLENDFAKITDKTSQEEINILYVAATRAQDDLDLSDCKAYQEMTITPSGD